MQGTPSSHHSSPSAVLLEPQRVPRYTPSQGERPTATPGSLHFASAFLRGRRSDSTVGRWPGGQDIPPRAGGDRTEPGVPSSLAPNRLLPADLDKSGWLWVANVIWGRAGGTPLHQKNRFRMDNCISQSGQEEGRAPPRPRPFPALRERGWGKERSRVTGTGALGLVVCAGQARLYTCTPVS